MHGMLLLLLLPQQLFRLRAVLCLELICASLRGLLPLLSLLLLLRVALRLLLLLLLLLHALLGLLLLAAMLGLLLLLQALPVGCLLRGKALLLLQMLTLERGVCGRRRAGLRCCRRFIRVYDPGRLSWSSRGSWLARRRPFCGARGWRRPRGFSCPAGLMRHGCLLVRHSSLGRSGWWRRRMRRSVHDQVCRRSNPHRAGTRRAAAQLPHLRGGQRFPGVALECRLSLFE